MVISAFSPPNSASASAVSVLPVPLGRPAGTPLRTVLRRQAGFRGAQAQRSGPPRQPPVCRDSSRLRSSVCSSFMRGERHAGPVGNHRRHGADVDVQPEQRIALLDGDKRGL